MKSCFVIMPIKQKQEEFQHFLSIYKLFYKEPVESCGYHVQRGDDLSDAGSITKDIVTAIAQSDLVIADLTDLNPNVFYELGVRHTLRRYGTILTLDEERSPHIPFNLANHRVKKYRSELAYLSRFREELIRAVNAIQQGAHEGADNPVHEFLPRLPIDMVQAQLAPEDSLVTDNAKLSAQLRLYEARFGQLTALAKSEETPEMLFEAMEKDIKEGRHGAKVFEDITAAFTSKDVGEFVTATRKLMYVSRFPPTVNQILEISRMASVRDLAPVSRVVIDIGLRFFPSNEKLLVARFASGLQSQDQQARLQAIEDASEYVGLVFEGESWRATSDFADLPQLKKQILYYLLDALRAERRFTDALKLTKLMYASMPHSSQVMRNYARALEDVNDIGAALPMFRSSILAKDVDDTSVSWYAATLSNNARHVDAVEGYLLACVMDPNDGHYFAAVAHCLTMTISAGMRQLSPPRTSPLDISKQLVLEFVRAALSCENAAAAQDRIRTAISRAELSLEGLDRSQGLGRTAREQLARSNYDTFASGLTRSDVTPEGESTH
ncbi:hypothetical protein GC169_08605 [bacterium]|nr:hypothetical protein [bacterium]